MNKELFVVASFGVLCCVTVAAGDWSSTLGLSASCSMILLLDRL